MPVEKADRVIRFCFRAIRYFQEKADIGVIENPAAEILHATIIFDLNRMMCNYIAKLQPFAAKMIASMK